LLPQHVEANDLDALVSGDELVGFVRAFLYAGTPSVLSSLWRVNDAATQRMMEAFYQQLPRKGKAASLQQAARSVIRSTLEVGRRKRRQISLKHPFFWSSFVLIGDWK
jgi:CHAT domain-containing protein